MSCDTSPIGSGEATSGEKMTKADADRAAVVAWPTLPDHIRAAVNALVAAGRGPER